jgi:hypothetical protein
MNDSADSDAKTPDAQAPDPTAAAPSAPQSAPSADAPQAAPSVGDRVVAPPAPDPAVRMFIAAGMFLLFGGWCFLEAYILKKYQYAPFSEDINTWATWAMNHYGPYVFLPPGLVLLVWAVLFRKRACIADDAGLHYFYFRKAPLRWEQITQLDASDLQDKGLLRLQHDTGRPLCLDSWKLKNFKPLVAKIDKHIPKEKVRG